MNNEKFDINCPHCGNVLVCEEALLGEQVTCPCCNKNFVVRIQQQTQKTNTTPKSSEAQKDYPWGRAYITFARLLATLVIAVVVCIIIKLLCLPFFSHSEQIESLKTNAVPLLVEKQNQFQKYFTKTIELITAPNHSGNTFKFPEDIAEHPDFFNETLLSQEDVEKSMTTLKLYDKKITQISSVMNDFFSRQYSQILNKLNSGNTIKMSFVSPPEREKKSPTPLLMTFDQCAHFYTDTGKNVSLEINGIRLLLRQLEWRKNELGYQHEIDIIKKGLSFIESQLKPQNEKIIKVSPHTSSLPRPKQTITSGKDKYILEKEILQQIIISLTRLSSHDNRNRFSWQISLKSQQLNEDLSEHLKHINKIDDEFKDSFRTALIYSLSMLLTGGFIAFLLMVFGDFLQAHFDSAFSLKSINGKIKNFLLLPLCLLLFLTGCENSPKEPSREELKHLQTLAINSIFAEKISDNPDASVYLIPGKELVLISGGVKKIFGEQFITAATCHAVSHLTCTSDASFSSLKEYNKPPYSHRALLRLKVKYMVKSTDTQKNPHGTPSTLIHFLPPTNFNSNNFDKAQWIENKLKEIPESSINHAVVLLNIAKNKPFFHEENKTYTIYYNSKEKIWELKNRFKEIAAPEPPVYSAPHLKQEMKRLGFKLFTTNVSGSTKNFWVQEKDYDIADKLWNQGLICVNGVWKKREIVFNTHVISDSLAEWKKKTRHTLDDLVQLLKAITTNPHAENINLAIEVAENELLTVFMQVPENPGEKDKNRLLELQSFIRTSPYFSNIDKKMIENACASKIDFVEKTIQRKKLNLKKKKGTLNQIIGTINDYHSEKYAKTLSNKLKKYFLSLDNKSLNEAFNHWLQIADIMQDPFSSRVTLYKKQGKFGEYKILTPCLACGGSGVKNCGVCSNTGACRICQGTGRRTTIMRTGAKRLKEITLSCPKECRSCNGQTKGCYVCYKGYVIEKDRLNEAYNAELEKLKKIVEKELISYESK